MHGELTIWGKGGSRETRSVAIAVTQMENYVGLVQRVAVQLWEMIKCWMYFEDRLTTTVVDGLNVGVREKDLSMTAASVCFEQLDGWSFQSLR